MSATPFTWRRNQRWWVVHSVEAGPSGTFFDDRFDAQTYEVDIPGSADGTPCNCSVFVPDAAATPGSQNLVHVFWLPGAAQGRADNGVTCHALRAAGAASSFILVAVPGAADGQGRSVAVTLSANRIVQILVDLGRDARIDALLLSAHSRGNAGLEASLPLLLKPSGPDAHHVAPDQVKRVTYFDNFYGSSQAALQAAGISPDRVFTYFAYPQDNEGSTQLGKYDKHSVDLADDPASSAALIAVCHSRIIGDALKLGTSPTPGGFPLLDLPALGQLTAQPWPWISRAASPAGVLTPFTAASVDPTVPSGADFIATNQAKIRDCLGLPETPFGSTADFWRSYRASPRTSDYLNCLNQVRLTWIDTNGNPVTWLHPADPTKPNVGLDLALMSEGFGPGIWLHQLFVAEFAHELTEGLDP